MLIKPVSRKTSWLKESVLTSLRFFFITLSTLYLAHVFVLASWHPSSEPNPNSTQDKVRLLSATQTIRQDVRGGEANTFQLPLLEGQFAQIVVEQQGVDVVLKVLGVDGNIIVEVDSPNSWLGPEMVSVIATSSGNHTIEVVADKREPKGSYELRIEGPRKPFRADERRVEAERLFMEAQKLRFRGGPNSRIEAVEKYNEALTIWRELGDARLQGYALCNIARVYKLIGAQKLKDSLDSFTQAEELLKEARDVPGQAFVLNEKAAAQRDRGDPEEALEDYRRALGLRIEIGDFRGQAHVFNNIGYVYSRIGYQKTAIENYDKALPLWQAVGDRYMEANTANNIALAYRELGELSFALNKFQQVLKFGREERDLHLQAAVLNNIGLIHDTWADPQTALDSYETALEAYRRLKDPVGEALVLENIGMVYAGLEDAARALQYFQDALKIRTGLKDSRGLRIVLNNLGFAEGLLGNYEEALKHLQLSLLLSREAKDRQFEAYALVNLGMIFVVRQDPAKALEHYQQALKIQTDLEDRRGQAITLDKIGQVYSRGGELSSALQNYQEALSRWISVGDRQGQALSLYGIAKVERDKNSLSEARARIEEAIEIIESLRSRMTGRQLQMTYFAARQDYYELNIDISMRLYGLAHSNTDMKAALFASERARARSLLDLLNEANAKIEIKSYPQVAERSRRVEQEIKALAESLLRLRNLKNVEDAAFVEGRLSRLFAEHDDLEAKIRAANPSYTQLSQPQPLKPDQIQELLDDDTLLLEYALGDKRSYLWAVTRTDVVAYTLPGRSDIEKAVENFRESLTAYEPPRPGEDNLRYLTRRRNATAQYRQRSLQLSSLVLKPVASKIENKRLVIVADGALQYVPFAALPIPSIGAGSETLSLSPLIARHEVIYQPSASALALIRAAPRDQATKSVAVLADPVFDKLDDRVRNTHKELITDIRSPALSSEFKRALRDAGDVGSEFKLERLRYSREEANAIVTAAAPGSWMKAVDFKANRATALSPQLKQFMIVHFATHGILNGKHPELSGLVLSLVDARGQPQDGFLRLGDIYNLDLPVDLVVLSACQTGVGKQVRGEGLIGLTRGFMHAGAARVVASLWKVDDEATAELMKRFYGYMLKEKLPAAAALRRAQLDVRERWQAPYYWAGFVLQGEWK